LTHRYFGNHARTQDCGKSIITKESGPMHFQSARQDCPQQKVVLFEQLPDEMRTRIQAGFIHVWRRANSVHAC
jgi:hypothetical protein